MKWLNGFSLAGVFEGEFSGQTRGYAGKGIMHPVVKAGRAAHPAVVTTPPDLNEAKLIRARLKSDVCPTQHV